MAELNTSESMIPTRDAKRILNDACDSYKALIRSEVEHGEELSHQLKRLRMVAWFEFGVIMALIAVVLMLSPTASAQTTDYLQQWQRPSVPGSIYETPQGQRYNMYTMPQQPQRRWSQAPTHGRQQFYFTPRYDGRFSARRIQPGFHPPSTQWGR